MSCIVSTKMRVMASHGKKMTSHHGMSPWSAHSLQNKRMKPRGKQIRCRASKRNRGASRLNVSWSTLRDLYVLAVSAAKDGMNGATSTAG